MRRAVSLFALALLGLLCTAPAEAAVLVLVIEGRGFGHGVGMAQDGALTMGRQGRTTEQILGQFYPGTSIGRGSGPVRVPVLDVGPSPASATISFPDGGEVRDSLGGAQSPGFPVAVQRGGEVTVTWDGTRYRAVVRGGTAASRSSSQQETTTTTTTTTLLPPPSSSSTTTTSTSTTTSTTLMPAPTTTTPGSTTSTTAPPPPSPSDGPSSGRPLWAVPNGGGVVGVPVRQRIYRGALEATAGIGRLRLVNQVDVETYLKGMGEVRDARWPVASLRVQAIAARTYALRAMAAGGEICETQRCQVYLGAQAEYAAMNRAVNDTAGQVLAFRGSLASAVYSANGGGHSASREEGFGTVGNDLPYLRPAPYPTDNQLPYTVRVALTDVAARLGYRGNLTSVTVGRVGPSGRALEVVLDGDIGRRSVTGIAFDAALGLRSTLFSLRLEEGEAPPPPPPAEDVVLQAPPEQAAAAAMAETPSVEDPAAVPDLPTAPSRSAPARPRRSDNRPWVAGGVVALLVPALAVTGVALRRLSRG
jgi:SpoIID/LytB domain protein